MKGYCKFGNKCWYRHKTRNRMNQVQRESDHFLEQSNLEREMIKNTRILKEVLGHLKTVNIYKMDQNSAQSKMVKNYQKE